LRRDVISQEGYHLRRIAQNLIVLHTALIYHHIAGYNRGSRVTFLLLGNLGLVIWLLAALAEDPGEGCVEAEASVARGADTLEAFKT
jgi:hypothetical protein